MWLQERLGAAGKSAHCETVNEGPVRTGQALAQTALALRYSDPALAPIRSAQLLEPRRYEDAGSDLWNVTNCVQKNLLRGGMRDTSRVNRAGRTFRPMRQIRGLGANVDINLGIWALPESFRSLN